MIIDYIHYKLGSSFEENNIDLEFIKVLPNKMRYYKSYRYSELYLPDKIIQIQIYLAFKENELRVMNYLVPVNTLKYFKGMINSYAQSPDEVLFKDPFQEQLNYSCIQDGLVICLNQFTKDVLSLRIAIITKNKE